MTCFVDTSALLAVMDNEVGVRDSYLDTPSSTDLEALAPMRPGPATQSAAWT